MFAPFIEPYVVNPLPMDIDLVFHISKENANFDVLRVSTGTARGLTMGMPGQGRNGRWKLKVPAFRFCGHPLRAPAAPATRTAVPRHHASGPGADTPAPHFDRRGGPPTQNPVPGWEHPSRHDPAGIPPTPSGARPVALAPSHSLPWRIRACAWRIPN